MLTTLASTHTAAAQWDSSNISNSAAVCLHANDVPVAKEPLSFFFTV